jgi:hypothetical protein
MALHKSCFMPEGFSRSGAKTQNAAAFLRFSFAALREKCFLSRVKMLTLSTFSAKLCGTDPEHGFE